MTAYDSEESASAYETGIAMSARTRADFFIQFEQTSAPPTCEARNISTPPKLVPAFSHYLRPNLTTPLALGIFRE